MITPLKAALLALAWPLGLLAQSTTITVDTTSAVRVVDERVFGVNATMWDGHAGTDQTISLLNAAGLRMIRVPGGSLSNEYHWRTNRTLTNTWTWATSFAGFSRLITGLAAQATVSVNYGTGTPEEAAGWVAYANAATTASGGAGNVTIGVDAKGYDWKTSAYWADLRAGAPLTPDDGMNFLRLGRPAPFGIKNWELGNENYGTWETDERPVAEQHDAFTYATRAKDYLSKMKAVDPTIKFGMVAVPGETDSDNGHRSHPATNPRTGAVRYGWTPVMLATLKSLGAAPDALIYHRYDQAPAQDRPSDPEGDAKLLQSSSTWPQDAAKLRQMLVDYLGAATATNVELVVTENNSVYSNPGKQSTSLVNALFYADSVGNLLQTEFNELVWWALRNGRVTNANNSASLYGWRNYGDYGILSIPANGADEAGYNEPYPTYYAFKQVANFVRGGDTVLTATSANPLLKAFAARRGNGALSVLVINKDPVNAIDGTLAFNGFTPQATARMHQYGKPQDDAARTGSESQDITSYDTGVNDRGFSASFPSYSLTVLTFEPMAAAVAARAAFAQPAAQATPWGGAATFTATSNASGPTGYQWQRNGKDLGNSPGSALSLTGVQPADTGLYRAIATAGGSSGTSEPVILGVAATSKVVGSGQEIGSDIYVSTNGNTFDQVQLDGAAAAITADFPLRQITRISFIDLTNDIVQVEMSGPGTLSLALDDASGPAAPVNYNQAVNYMKGHAGIVITGATEETNVSVFSVGRKTAVNQALFKDEVTYDGVADIAFIAIASSNGRFGGVRTANANYFAHQGLTGIYAPGVQFAGPVFVGNITAFDAATPVFVIGSSPDTRITGGDLFQSNGSAVQESGLTQLKFTAGGDSQGNPLPVKANRAVLTRNGVDVTAQIVGP